MHGRLNKLYDLYILRNIIIDGYFCNKFFYILIKACGFTGSTHCYSRRTIASFPLRSFLFQSFFTYLVRDFYPLNVAVGVCILSFLFLIILSVYVCVWVDEWISALRWKVLLLGSWWGFKFFNFLFSLIQVASQA